MKAILLFFNSEMIQVSTPEPASDTRGHWPPSTEGSWEGPAVQPSSWLECSFSEH